MGQYCVVNQRTLWIRCLVNPIHSTVRRLRWGLLPHYLHLPLSSLLSQYSLPYFFEVRVGDCGDDVYELTIVHGVEDIDDERFICLQ
jgi:hypothetical protein